MESIWFLGIATNHLPLLVRHAGQCYRRYEWGTGGILGDLELKAAEAFRCNDVNCVEEINQALKIMHFEVEA